MTTFDFVLLLMIAETTQQALLGDDFSVTNSSLLIVKLVGMDIPISYLKRHFELFDRLIDGVPMVIFENGRPLVDRLENARIDQNAIMSAACKLQGAHRLDQVRRA